MTDSISGFAYYVFASREEAPTEAERTRGVYLRGSAAGRYLDRYFSELHRTHSVEITMSGDACICGDIKLRALRTAIERAQRDVAALPPSWPMVMGYEFAPGEEADGREVVQSVSREELLTFLSRALGVIGVAEQSGACVHFGGGE